METDGQGHGFDFSALNNFHVRLIKTKIQKLFTKLGSLGEEYLVITVDCKANSFSYLGSSCGVLFLQNRPDIMYQFYHFCVDQHSTQKLSACRICKGYQSQHPFVISNNFQQSNVCPTQLRSLENGLMNTVDSSNVILREDEYRKWRGSTSQNKPQFRSRTVWETPERQIQDGLCNFRNDVPEELSIAATEYDIISSNIRKETENKQHGYLHTQHEDREVYAVTDGSDTEFKKSNMQTSCSVMKLAENDFPLNPSNKTEGNDRKMYAKHDINDTEWEKSYSRISSCCDMTLVKNDYPILLFRKKENLIRETQQQTCPCLENDNYEVNTELDGSERVTEMNTNSGGFKKVIGGKLWDIKAKRGIETELRGKRYTETFPDRNCQSVCESLENYEKSQVVVSKKIPNKENKHGKEYCNQNCRDNLVNKRETKNVGDVVSELSSNICKENADKYIPGRVEKVSLNMKRRNDSLMENGDNQTKAQHFENSVLLQLYQQKVSSIPKHAQKDNEKCFSRGANNKGYFIDDTSVSNYFQNVDNQPISFELENEAPSSVSVQKCLSNSDKQKMQTPISASNTCLRDISTRKNESSKNSKISNRKWHDSRDRPRKRVHLDNDTGGRIKKMFKKIQSSLDNGTIIYEHKDLRGEDLMTKEPISPPLLERCLDKNTSGRSKVNVTRVTNGNGVANYHVDEGEPGMSANGFDAANEKTSKIVLGKSVTTKDVAKLNAKSTSDQKEIAPFVAKLPKSRSGTVKCSLSAQVNKIKTSKWKRPKPRSKKKQFTRRKGGKYRQLQIANKKKSICNTAVSNKAGMSAAMHEEVNSTKQGNDKWRMSEFKGRRSQCYTCGKMVVSSRLDRHKDSHSRPRPFLCLECYRRFTSLHKLEKHQKKGHGY